MRIMTWNCCWKLREKLPAILAEEPHIAVLQECSEQDLKLFPANYKSHWLGGAIDHGLGLICREPYSVRSIHISDLSTFAAVQISGPVQFTLIAAWNCKQPGCSYPEQLHQLLDQHRDWFESGPLILAGDLNSQAGASFDTGKRRHAQFVERLSQLGLTDSRAEDTDDIRREATYRHLRSETALFHLDYIFIPHDWVSKVSSVTVGSSSYWSKLSDHSPVMLTLNDV